MAHRQGTIWVLMTAYTAIGLFLGAFASAEERLVREFRYGVGAAELGLIDGAQDALGVGPAALAVQHGTFFIVDRVKSRVLHFRSIDSQPETIDLGAGSDPIDVVVLGDTIYVRDAVSAQLIRIERAGVATPGQPEAAGPALALQTAQAILFHAGFRVTGNTTGRPEMGTGELGGTAGIDLDMLVASDPGQQIMASSGQTFVARFVPSPLRLGADVAEYRGIVVVAPVDNLEHSTHLVLRLPGIVKAAQLMAIAADGRFFVAVDEIVSSMGQEESIRRTILEYDAAGNQQGRYEVPLSPLGVSVTRPVSVNSDGKVYALVVASDALRVVELPRLTTDILKPAAPVLPLAPPAPVLGTAELGQSAPKVSRVEILTLANQYVTTQWKAPQAAFTSTSSCNPTNGHFWRRPQHIKNVSQPVTGVPYCWGCADSVKQFLEATRDGTKLPGNTCAHRDCAACMQPQKTAGVDCSGFVSNVWRLTRHVNTASLPAIALPIPRYDELEPGDIFNRAGSHVIMYAGTVLTSAGEMVMIYPEFDS